MTDKEKIRAEIERRITMLRIGCKHSEANELLPILSFIDSLQDEEPNAEETELNSLAFLEQLGYTCIPPKKSWPPQDNTPTYASTEYKVSKELTTNQNMDSSDAKCGQLDELEEEVHRYWNDHVLEYRRGRVADVDFVHLTARHFAEWQKKQDEETIELAEDHAMLAGRIQMKEEMMREAVEGSVIVSYIAPSGEQYGNIVSTDVEIDRFSLNEGDKVKLIIIKDDETRDS